MGKATWRLISATVQSATRIFVSDFQKLSDLPGERPIKASRMKFLKGQLDTDAFRIPVWASVKVKETGLTYHVNGQHTATLLAEANGRARGQKVFFEEYECETLADAAGLYSTFDYSEGSRSAHDINSAYAAAIPELAGTDKKVITLAISGLSFLRCGSWYAGLTSKTQRAERMERYVPDIIWFSEVSSGKDRGLLRKAPVAAAMLASYAADPTKATTFWTNIREGSRSAKSHEGQVRELLLKAKIGTRKPGKNDKVIGSAELYDQCVKHWNAQNKDRHLQLHDQLTGKQSHAPNKS